jgi:hypothetical protein
VEQHDIKLQDDTAVPSIHDARYRQLVIEMAASKRVAHLRSPREMAAFLDDVRNEFSVG